MNLAWYFHRLRAMSLAEVIHRLRERRKRGQWRHYADGWAHFRQDEAWPLPALPGLDERIEAAARAHPGFAQHLAAETAALLSGNKLILLGTPWPPGTLSKLEASDPALFLRDPVSGAVWPGAKDYCFDVPYRHATSLGDIKYLWEINRLQFLHIAAAHTRLAGGKELADRIFALFDAWMEANPPFRGPNWASGIELSLRIVTLIIVVSLLGEPESPVLRERLRTFLAAHLFWLARYPSRHSSANNHLIAEGLGLYLAGTLAPGLTGAASHAAEGRAILERECLKQIYADGTGAEQSPTYTAFAMEMTGLALLCGRLTGAPFSAAAEDRLRAGAQWLAWLQNDEGDVPAIGDNDEGRVIASSIDSEPRYAHSMAASIGALTGLKEIARLQCATGLREAIFGVAPGPGVPLLGVQSFEEGGYSAVRWPVEGRLAILVFDHGPLGYLSIAAHGHADALAIWLDIAAHPALVDAGTWLYHSGGADRDAFRSTGVHNTVLVEGASQSIPAGAFNWSNKAQGRLLASSKEPFWSFDGEHDGYLRRFGVKHVRRVEQSGANGFRVIDRLIGNGAPRLASIRFLMAPGIALSGAGRTWRATRNDGLHLSVTGPAGFEGQALTPGAQPAEGWVSERFGHRTPSALLAFDGPMGPDPRITEFTVRFSEAAGLDKC